MPGAYVDTSWLLGIAFGEAGGRRLVAELESFDPLVAANLLQGEFSAAHRREGRQEDRGLLARLRWIHPERALETEIGRVLEHGYVCGADCRHLAAALYFAGAPADLTFLTLDARLAAALGFRTRRKR
jgi:hypothetical protein